MKLPYLLLADDDIAQRTLFLTAFEKQIAYATVSAVDDGRTLLAFLGDCDWRDLPSLIIFNYRLRDTTAPDLLRELLLDTRFMKIPKIIRTRAGDAREVNECRILGVKYFLTMPDDLFELENNVRRIDELLKAELHLI